jgi:hypothetical protein
VLAVAVQLDDAKFRSPQHVVRIRNLAGWADIFRQVGCGVVRHLLRIEPKVLAAMQDGRIAILHPAYSAAYLKIQVLSEVVVPPAAVPAALEPQPAEQLPVQIVIATNAVESARRSGIASSHVYTIDAIVAGLQLRWALKRSAISFLDISKHVWTLTLHPTLAKVVSEQSANLHLPSRAVLDRSELKLDVLTCNYWAHQLDTHDSFGYLMIDSSPQGGWDLFACLDDVLNWPKHLGTRAQITMDLAAHWSRRMLPLSCLGKGCSSTFHRAYSLFMKPRLVSGNQLVFPRAS